MSEFVEQLELEHNHKFDGQIDREKLKSFIAQNRAKYIEDRPKGFLKANGPVSYTHLDVYKRQMQWRV